MPSLDQDESNELKNVTAYYVPFSAIQIISFYEYVKPTSKQGAILRRNLLMNPGVVNPRAVFPPKFQPLSRPEIAAPNHAVKRRGDSAAEFVDESWGA